MVHQVPPDVPLGAAVFLGATFGMLVGGGAVGGSRWSGTHHRRGVRRNSPPHRVVVGVQHTNREIVDSAQELLVAQRLLRVERLDR